MIKKTSLLVIYMYFTFVNAQQGISNSIFKVETIKYNEYISFPYISSSSFEGKKVAERINKGLQGIIFEKEQLINNDNLNLIKPFLYINKENDSTQSGIASLSCLVDFHKNFTKITADIDWAGGPYPVSAETYHLYFDLQTGELIQFPDLIDGEKYFDFLEKLWLPNCRNSIKEAHQCAYENRTGNYNSKKAFTLEGECEFQCHLIENDFIIEVNSITLRNNPNCYPHMWQNCNFVSSKKISKTNLKPYLSDYGKWLLELSSTYSKISPFVHFVGKIADKYKISMSIDIGKTNNVKGIYFYWNQNKRMLLFGKINEGKKKLFIDEKTDSSNTGRFELEWDNFQYSTDGIWYNSSKEKKLPVKLRNIYDYSDRNFSR